MVFSGWKNVGPLLNTSDFLSNAFKWSGCLDKVDTGGVERYLLHVMVVHQMQLPRLETVLTFTFIENVRLKLVTRTRRLFPRHGALLCRENDPNTRRRPAPALGIEWNQQRTPERTSVKRSARAVLTTVVMDESSDVTTSGHRLQNKTIIFVSIFRSFFVFP